MARKALFVLLGVLTVLAAIFVPKYFASYEESPDAGPPPGPGAMTGSRGGGAPFAVNVHRAAPRALKETVTANGTVLANESVDLRSEISGIVTAIHLEEGAVVQAGDLLVKIDDSELAAQLQRTLYRIELAKAQEARQKQLVERGGTSREAYDEAVYAVRVLEAEAELIRAQLKKTELRAPFGGVVGLRYVSVGSYLTPTTRIATLQDLDRLKIDFSISERYMDRVHPGSRITFAIAGHQERHTGKVYAVEPRVDEATRTVILRANATNPDRRLLPGAFASVQVTLDEIPDALLIPTTAVIPGLNQQTVFVVENGKAAVRAVETGIRLDREIQITAGLQPGDLVITSGILQVRPGMPVKPIEPR